MQILKEIPITYGDRLYWEAEMAQANKELETAMLKCRESFSLKARYISRCIRMAGEIHEARDSKIGLAQRMEYEEYMLRLLNAFLSGGDYLPCRQIFQKHILLRGMVHKYIKLNRIDLAIERAEMLFAGRVEFLEFMQNPKGRYSLMFQNNDSLDCQMETKQQLDSYVASAVNRLKSIPNYENNQKIKSLLEKYNLL